VQWGSSLKKGDEVLNMIEEEPEGGKEQLWVCCFRVTDKGHIQWKMKNKPPVIYPAKQPESDWVSDWIDEEDVRKVVST